MAAGTEDLEAVRAAIYLFHLQSGVRAAREQPLPAGMPLLLEVAAGEAEMLGKVATRLERPADTIRQAAEFYLEHVVLKPDADAFRTLGCRRDSTDAELRRNMAFLLRWAHPDVDRAGERSVFAGRVTRSWEALKTPERRATYEAANPMRLTPRAAEKPKSRSTVANAQASHLVGLPTSSSSAVRAKAPKQSRARRLIGQALRFIVGARRTGR